MSKKDDKNKRKAELYSKAMPTKRPNNEDHASTRTLDDDSAVSGSNTTTQDNTSTTKPTDNGNNDGRRDIGVESATAIGTPTSHGPATTPKTDNAPSPQLTNSSTTTDNSSNASEEDNNLSGTSKSQTTLDNNINNNIISGSSGSEEGGERLGSSKTDGKISEQSGTILQGGEVSADKKVETEYNKMQSMREKLAESVGGIESISSIVKPDSSSAEALNAAKEDAVLKDADLESRQQSLLKADAESKVAEERQQSQYELDKAVAEENARINAIDWSGDTSNISKDDAAKAMSARFPDSRVDLLNRPSVPGAEMVKAGWPQDAFPSYNVKGRDILVTPIVDNGDGTYTVMSPDELGRYVGSLDPNNPESDVNGIVISWNSDPVKDGKDLHKMQEAYYRVARPTTINGETVTTTDDTKTDDTKAKAASDGSLSFTEQLNNGDMRKAAQDAAQPTMPLPGFTDNKGGDQKTYDVTGEDVGNGLKSLAGFTLLPYEGKETEDGDIDYSDSYADELDRLDAKEKEERAELDKKIQEYKDGLDKASKEGNFPAMLAYQQAKAKYEEKLKEYDDPDKIKKRRTRKLIAAFTDVLAGLANMAGAYHGAKPIQLKSSAGAMERSDKTQDTALQKKIEELAKAVETARKEAASELSKLEKADQEALKDFKTLSIKDLETRQKNRRTDIVRRQKDHATKAQKKADAKQRAKERDEEYERKDKDRVKAQKASVETHEKKTAISTAAAKDRSDHNLKNQKNLHDYKQAHKGKSSKDENKNPANPKGK